jgi:hypothetical protein
MTRPVKKPIEQRFTQAEAYVVSQKLYARASRLWAAAKAKGSITGDGMRDMSKAAPLTSIVMDRLGQAYFG